MKKSNGFCLIVVSLATMIGTSISTQAKKLNSDQRPNIIHIMTDDHSFQTISAYEHPISKLASTPNLDRLANEGILFEQVFVENSLSTPSCACLMIGLYSHQNGQRQLGKGIDSIKTFFPNFYKSQDIKQP